MSVHVRFVVENGGKGTVFFSQYCGFAMIVFSWSVLHTHTHSHFALTGRENGRRLGTFQKSSVLSEIRKRWMEENLHFFLPLKESLLL